MRLTAFRVGAAAWTVTGLVHDALELALPGDPELEAAMRAASVQLGPVSLEAAALYRGLSLAMGLAMIVAGVLLWMIARAFRTEPERARPFGFVALAGSAAVLALAAFMIPGPPLVTFGVATAAFAVALAPRRAAR
ncbi:LIC_13387 family protein [Glycomyces terrestris]|uniref:Uncharacterized protein n=1 Tax=Glycomyces terrestris TaxID=2493553 RepID=A0A426V0R8_9ACTN|nr:hypothetical protein [Glycomyces terrestris]RRS00452.1 hypothetical protein EIW28_07765 [Glycomyces terrestris]